MVDKHRTVVRRTKPQAHHHFMLGRETDDVASPPVIVFVELHAVLNRQIPTEFINENRLTASMQGLYFDFIQIPIRGGYKV